MSLRQMQKEQDEWSKRNFDNKKPYQPILGAAEEVGELAHAYLKMEQGIRGNTDEHTANMKDAVADSVEWYKLHQCQQVRRVESPSRRRMDSAFIPEPNTLRRPGSY